ncbi:MAG: VOC family protein [Anaerolineae bacterium]|nr:VOC family protein [Anaerolineae bacterium]
MTSELQFDHAVILVNDLEQASEDYRSLGFHVFFGGEHADGKTHNALIVFSDGSYLELLAPTDTALLKQVDPDDRSSFLFLFARGEGFGGYALLSANLEADVARMQSEGLPIQMRPAGGRARPDGQVLRWQSAVLEGSMTPFFIQDVTPRNLRVSDDPELTTHENGAYRFSSIVIPTSEIDTGVAFYRGVLGAEPYLLNPNNDPEPPTQAHFDTGRGTIVLSSNLNDAVAGVPYQINLLSRGSHVFVDLDTQLTHGARIFLHPF